jgi:hypothetical protein
MDRSMNNLQGYVYILQVKDIDLPVCKIGMTTRNPYQRCEEINISSTGDFIWEVAHSVAVSDCGRLESLVHQKLEPLRQKRREFFNLNPTDAYQAMLSIIDHQHEITFVNVIEPVSPDHTAFEKQKRQTQRVQQNSRSNEKYVEMLDAFTTVLGIKGRPFGQLNKPYFGMSDGNDGVQWNIVIFTDTDKATLGINLEGMKYKDWPIARFIISELKTFALLNATQSLSNPERVFVRFTRDAWQVTSRPLIEEQYIGGKQISLSDLNESLWLSMLKEALECLDEKKKYYGRKTQEVTLANKQRNGFQKRMLPVSPHLNVWTNISFDGDILENLINGTKLLTPLYERVKKILER